MAEHSPRAGKHQISECKIEAGFSKSVLFQASSEKQTGSSHPQFQGALVSMCMNSEYPPTKPLHSTDIFL